jgi:3-oxoacyl-[acyl-carrier protein] reductase
MDLGLTDRVYVLTGASKGLGYATAQCLVAEGARVVISGRDLNTVEEAAESLGLDTAVGTVADLGDEDAADRLVSLALERYGRLDGVLISVGGPPFGNVLDVTDEQWQAAFGTVFLGAVRMARAAAAHLEETGVIGFVLSTSVRVPIPGLAISNGLRPGLASLAKELADELGPQGIRVLGFLPGGFLTDRGRELMAAGGDEEQAIAEKSKSIPLGRMGEPEEFGKVAAFALSPAASYVSGTMLTIDGAATRAI